MQLAREILEENVKFFRQSKGLSQRKLSKECGYDRTYLNKIENGKRVPNLPVLCNLAFALDVEIARLFKLSHPKCYEILVEEIQSINTPPNDKLKKYLKKRQEAFGWDMDGFLLLNESKTIKKSVFLSLDKRSIYFNDDVLCHCEKDLNELPLWDKLEQKDKIVQDIATYLAEANSPGSIQIELDLRQKTDASVLLSLVSLDLADNFDLLVEIQLT